MAIGDEIKLLYTCNSCSKQGQQYEFYLCCQSSTDNKHVDSHCSRGIQCLDCVKLVPSSSYCPFCLFEVTSSSVKSDRNHCSRNCFFCPCCLKSPLVLVASTAEDVTPSPFTLSCSLCGWDSFIDSGIVLERPTGINGGL
jgi:hypothetical protein